MKYDIEKMLPHSRPMILIDSIEEVNLDNDSICASVTIKEDCLFFDKELNGVSYLVGIEFMAQTIACCAYLKSRKRKPKIGFLLGTRSYKSSLEKFENNKTYTVRVKKIYSDNELVSFECFIYNDFVECASAVVSAYQP